ncbi:MAG: site-specific DNA-methyltransferase [Clostridiales bacterium]|jgi:hypothetical protein|nr:site-specific DNA-methyltransferase [Clostridiales bacterium]
MSESLAYSYQGDNDLLSMQEASAWATKHTGRNVTVSNISYLIQYGRVRKNRGLISINDLENYYRSFDGVRENNYKLHLGDDINWTLSFSNIKESETTKHVHRLHPYKGKFIPHLVEYFIGSHTDNFKNEIYFHQGDLILDPFAGSGTTLVQANECGINAVGIDVSAFNSLIANCKITQYDIEDIKKESKRISSALREFVLDSKILDFQEELLPELNRFNNEFFPVPDYKYRLRQGEVNENEYGREMEKKFEPTYLSLVKKYKVKLCQEKSNNFLEKWFFQQVRDEIDFVFEQIKKISNIKTKKIFMVILSRTMRSCRATTHSDLATLIDPITSTYYCSKHGKICKPLFTIIKWWESYCKDTIARLNSFNNLRTPTMQYCITADSRSVDIINELRKSNPALAEMVSERKINGIFSSPPYVGLIDYHEQHAYAYDLFGYKRNDDSEIGPLFKGKGKEARQSYADGISQVLINCKQFLAEDYNVFLVANDRYNLYPKIAEGAGMRIMNEYRRPVLNRSEKDKTAYSETIFHLKEV